MRNLYYYLIFVVFLNACSVTNNIGSNVHHAYDEVKQEELSKYEIDLPARSLWKKSNKYNVHLVFKQRKQDKKKIRLLQISTGLGLDKEIQDSIYFIIHQKIFRVPLNNPHYFLKEGINTHTENKIIKPKDSTENEILTTDIYSKHYRYNYVKAKAELPDKLIEQILSADKMRIRFYINEDAYDIKLNQFFMKKIKKLYQSGSEREENLSRF